MPIIPSLRWRRLAMGLAATLALLVVVAAIALHALVDPERLKELAREKARDAWSREITIGDMRLRWLPLPSLHASDVSVADVPDDKDPWSLHADSVVVGWSSGRCSPASRGQAMCGSKAPSCAMDTA
jgi:uncharacterized protein involved in outer membrane biogenesis